MAGNYIGTDATGFAALGNRENGVDIQGATANTIGGTVAGARNIISANGIDGVAISSIGATGNVVLGNYIGTTVTGGGALGNIASGVQINGAPSNTIGGTAVGARNIISTNGAFGVLILHSGATGNVIAGNYIGTNAAGTARLGNHSDGVRLGGASGTTVGGTTTAARNVISGNDDDGIEIQGNTATGNVVAGNFIGTNAAGVGPLGNGNSGVAIVSVGGNTVGGSVAGARNVISGNATDGVAIGGSGATGNVVVGNYVGTNAAGSAVLGNGGSGVAIAGAPNTTVGGLTALARNVISGNVGSGVAISLSTATGNVVRGNYLGTGATGSTDLGNTENGVFISRAPNNTIGGMAAGARNAISGNRFGVRIEGSGATGNGVVGNYIGTNAAGTAALGNDSDGVYVTNAPANTVGGTAAAARNVISGNGGAGVEVFGFVSTGNVVQGNFIGTDATGTVVRGNGSSGVLIALGAANTAVGGTAVGAGNLIAFNGGDGVSVTGGGGNAVLSNRMYANAGLGIDLGTDGVTPNDVGDGDIGSNGLQNFPELSAAFNGNSSFTIQGQLRSTPSTAFRVEFFASTASDPTGYGEGDQLLGSATVTTDVAGNTDFVVSFATTRPVGLLVSATATRLVDHDASPATPLVPRDTSEFSHVSPVVGSLAGRKFHDQNGNGVQDATEPALPNWTIYLDANGDGQLSVGEITDTTDAAGEYVFVDPPLGTNTIREMVQPGWMQSSPGPAANWAHTPTLAAGQYLTHLDFGNYQPAAISGRVFHDLDANGVQGGEPALPNWTVYVDANNNGQLDAAERSALTNAAGDYLFGGLRPGTHVVREVLQAGWLQSAPEAGSHTVTLVSGQSVIGRAFGNYRPVTIMGTVFHDYDTNGLRGGIEPGMPNWRVYLDANNNGLRDVNETAVVTDPAGRYLFTGLRPGTYVAREELQSGWRQTAPAAGAHTITLTSGQAALNRDFGNTPVHPMLIILLSPASVSEGAGPGAVTTTVIRSGVAPTAALTVSLSSSDTTEARVPATLAIPVGQSAATFLIDAIDDLLVDGTQFVLIPASAAGFASGSETLFVTDDD